jgi:hypothetical protein
MADESNLFFETEEKVLKQRQKYPIVMHVILGLNMLFSVAFLFWLTDHYQKACPRILDEEHGIVYPLNKHGSIVYLDRAQHRKFVLTYSYLMVSGALFVVGGEWTRRRTRR